MFCYGIVTSNIMVAYDGKGEYVKGKHTFIPVPKSDDTNWTENATNVLSVPGYLSIRQQNIQDIQKDRIDTECTA